MERVCLSSPLLSAQSACSAVCPPELSPLRLPQAHSRLQSSSLLASSLLAEIVPRCWMTPCAVITARTRHAVRRYLCLPPVHLDDALPPARAPCWTSEHPSTGHAPTPGKPFALQPCFASRKTRHVTSARINPSGKKVTRNHIDPPSWILPSMPPEGGFALLPRHERAPRRAHVYSTLRTHPVHVQPGAPCARSSAPRIASPCPARVTLS